MIFALGLVILTKGADILVDGAVDIAKHYGIPEFIIGATIIAFGTSLPELGTSVYAAYIGTPSLAVSNVLGSNIANICLVVGVAAFIHTIHVKWNSIKMDMIFFIATAMVLLVGYQGGSIGKAASMFFVSLYILYIYFQVRKGRIIYRKLTEEMEIGLEPPRETKGIGKKSLLLIGLGIFAVVIGAEFLVHSAIELAQYYGVSERIIGLTLVALGTSLPELAASGAAALKGRPQIAISNIIGSNIFNVFMVLGLSGIFGNLVLEADILSMDIPVVLGTTVLMALLIFWGKIGRLFGTMLLLLYIIYISLII